MTWLQQLLPAVSATLMATATAAAAGASAGSCADVAHVAAADVAHQPEAGVETGPAFSVDVGQLDMPVVADVLRRRGQAGPVTGETLIGIAITDGQSVTFQGPAVNAGQPVTLGPDCRPLEPQAAD